MVLGCGGGDGVDTVARRVAPALCVASSLTRTSEGQRLLRGTPLHGSSPSLQAAPPHRPRPGGSRIQLEPVIQAGGRRSGSVRIAVPYRHTRILVFMRAHYGSVHTQDEEADERGPLVSERGNIVRNIGIDDMWVRPTFSSKARVASPNSHVFPTSQHFL
jgi:hypothetical protein